MRTIRQHWISDQIQYGFVRRNYRNEISIFSHFVSLHFVTAIILHFGASAEQFWCQWKLTIIFVFRHQQSVNVSFILFNWLEANVSWFIAAIAENQRASNYKCETRDWRILCTAKGQGSWQWHTSRTIGESSKSERVQKKKNCEKFFEICEKKKRNRINVTINDDYFVVIKNR